MRKLFILPLIILFGCSSEAPQGNTETNPKNITSDVNHSKSPELVVIGHYNVEGGELHIYTFSGDTLYWAEGRSTSYPVSLIVK